MAAERKEKLKSQQMHYDHAVDKVTTNVKHSPKSPKDKSPKDQSPTGKQSPKNTVPAVKEKMSHKRSKQKVCALNKSRCLFIQVLNNV